MGYNIADLPEDAFLHGQSPLPKVSQDQAPLFVEKVEYSEKYGALWYLRGFKFPRKGRFHPLMTRDVDQVKKYVKNWLLFFGSSPMKYLLPVFVFLPLKTVAKRWLMLYSDFAFTTLRSHYLDPKWYPEPIREIRTVLLKVFGGTLEADRVIESLCVMLNAEPPYCYRVQDILQELDKKNALKRPYRELRRLFNLLSERDKQRGWKEIGFVVSLFVALRFRKEFKECVRLLVPSSFNFDESDLYYFLLNDTAGTEDGYDVMGLTHSQRVKLHAKL